jgi:ribonuclease D
MTEWIDTPGALRARLTHPPTAVGLDTEFIRERTYWPQLALVQIALGESEGDILLVDPLQPGMCEALAPLLADPAVLVDAQPERGPGRLPACLRDPAGLFDTRPRRAASVAVWVTRSWCRK